MSSKSLRRGCSAVREAGLFRRANLGMCAAASTTRFGSGAATKAVRTLRVGFIGLDRTGQAMASRLMHAGHQLTLYDPAQEIPEALQSAGACLANCIEDACRSADAVFTMLPNDEVAEAVVLGPGGVVENLARDSTHIGSSTISIECSDRIVEAHWDAGRKFVSAPVVVRSGSPGDTQLFVIAGGHEATIMEVEPLLSPLGQLAQLKGWPSAANQVQLEVNCSGGTLFQFLARHPELRGGVEAVRQCNVPPSLS